MEIIQNKTIKVIVVVLITITLITSTSPVFAAKTTKGIIGTLFESLLSIFTSFFDGGYSYPIKDSSKYISQAYGNGHSGVDITCNSASGKSIYATHKGEVTFAGSNGTYGNLVRIKSGDVEMYYAHCNSILVSVGNQVKKGDQIATIGNTGASSGPHLHYEVKVNGSIVNPSNYM